MVKDINIAGDAEPRNLTNIQGTLYFAADDGNFGRELWKSDGTEVGTVRVKDINIGLDNAIEQVTSGKYIDSYEPLRFSDGRFLFGADDSLGIEPWVSNGTETGTTRIQDVNVGIDRGFVTE